MNNSYKIAIAVAIAFALWMSAGVLLTDLEVDSESMAEQSSQSSAIIVEAQTIESELVTSYVISQGSLLPNREVTLKSETAGQINELMTIEGASITSGESLLRLKLDDRAIRKEQSSVKLIEKQRNYEAVENVVDKGFASKTELDTALVELKMAEVELAKINLEIEKTTIKAPFDGIIEEMKVDLGDFVNVGTDVLTIVDNNPLVVNIYVSQEDVDYLDTSIPVRVQLINDKEKMGQIRFISPRADAATRTFRVEIAIPNNEGLRSGSSATAFLPKEEVKAHYLSAGLLTLNDAGEVGIKTVDAEGLVSFYAINIESSDTDGMWVSGLPDRATIITAGQGFAAINERVSVSLIPSKDKISAVHFPDVHIIQ
jgi:membrane fusion protein, multidrug efflux system